MRFRLTMNILGMAVVFFNLLSALAKPHTAPWLIPFFGSAVLVLVVGLILSMIDYADYLRRKEKPRLFQ